MPPAPAHNYVTLALVVQKLDYLTDLHEQHLRLEDVWRKDHEDRLRCLEEKSTRMEERQASLSRGQTIYASIVASISGIIAAVIGSRS